MPVLSFFVHFSVTSVPLCFKRLPLRSPRTLRFKLWICGFMQAEKQQTHSSAPSLRLAGVKV